MMSFKFPKLNTKLKILLHILILTEEPLNYVILILYIEENLKKKLFLKNKKRNVKKYCKMPSFFKK